MALIYGKCFFEVFCEVLLKYFWKNSIVKDLTKKISKLVEVNQSALYSEIIVH